MPRPSRTHIGLYGSVKLLRGYCPSCCSWAFVLDGMLQCCNRHSSEQPVKKKRMIIGHGQRRRPHKEVQKRLLAQYQQCCAYCGRLFGLLIIREKRVMRLRLEWDHNEPFVYSQTNAENNWIPSCHLCNRWKSDKIFDDLDELKNYVADKWKDKGYETVSDVS